MVKVAAIDCGSNSTRLLISNVENGRLQNLLKQHEVTKLSENLIQTNQIADDSKKRFYKKMTKKTYQAKDLGMEVGKFLKVFTNTSDKLPSPGPSSTKLKILGFPKVSQDEIIHIAIISENKFDIVGDVTKSPFLPKGILFS